MMNRLKNLRPPTATINAVILLGILRDMLGGLPHPDDRGATIWSLQHNDYLLSREEIDQYDLIMEGIFAVLGDATYDIAMLLNAEMFDK